MKLFLDSANLDEIRHALDLWDIDGLTTNPRHIKNSGQPFWRLIEEIAELFEGTNKPVSVEVNPRLTAWEAIVDNGLRLAAISPNIVVKVGAGEAGFKAVRELASRGVRTNVTLVFSIAQAWHAARAGATYISPFLGWKEAHGEDTSAFLPQVVRMLAAHRYPTQVIAAAIRNARQIGEAAAAGAHCCTTMFEVWRDSFRSPFTDMGHELFGAAWDATRME
ncbi:MAG: transaldolase [Isosphaeraceae bacterium]|nr:transaldolase [Isosphaeraceae bacterium]